MKRNMNVITIKYNTIPLLVSTSKTKVVVGYNTCMQVY